MTNPELIKKFETTLAERERARLYTPSGIQQEFEAAIKCEWERVFPKRKFNALRASEELTNYADIQKPFIARAKEIREKAAAEFKRLKQELEALADQITIDDTLKTPHEFKVLFARSSANDYRTTGSGEKYAEAVAIIFHRDQLEKYGVVCNINKKTDNPPLIDFEVWACCTELACEIIRLKETQPFREIVRKFWKKSCQPRVYFPFLETGYEDQNGLDYFGGEKQKGDAHVAIR